MPPYFILGWHLLQYSYLILTYWIIHKTYVKTIPNKLRLTLLYDFSFDNRKLWIITLVTCALLIRFTSIFRSAASYDRFIFVLCGCSTYDRFGLGLYQIPSQLNYHPPPCTIITNHEFLNQKYIVYGVSGARYSTNKRLMEDIKLKGKMVHI